MTRAERFAGTMDENVLRFIPTDGSIGTVDLQNWGFKLTSLRASLKRLESEGLIKTRWDGNERFGRYLYTRA